MLVDIDRRTLNITPEIVLDAVTPRTRAVVAVHIAGLAMDIERLVALLEPRGIAVVEDAAHAFPSRIGGPDGRHAGTFGKAGAFSFYATKTITTGEGGMLVTDDDAIADRARVMSLHGISRDAWNRYAENGSWYYEIEDAGYKYNMTDIAAALGLVQLERARELLAARRRSRRRIRGSSGLLLPRTCWNSRRTPRTDRTHGICMSCVWSSTGWPSIGSGARSDGRAWDRDERSLHSAPLTPVLPAPVGQSTRGPSRGHEGICAGHFLADLARHDRRRRHPRRRVACIDPRERPFGLNVVGPEPFTLSEYPGFLPGLAVSVLLAMLLYRYLGRRLGISEPVALLLLISFGAIVAATLTPGHEAFPPMHAGASCDVSRIGPAPLTNYTALGTTGLNVLLFVPLGALIALLPRSRVMAFAVVGAALLPFTIEAIQLAATPLDRACQSGDVVDNMLGLALGLAAGWTGVWISRRAAKQLHRGTSLSG